MALADFYQLDVDKQCDEQYKTLKQFSHCFYIAQRRKQGVTTKTKYSGTQDNQDSCYWLRISHFVHP